MLQGQQVCQPLDVSATLIKTRTRTILSIVGVEWTTYGLIANSFRIGTHRSIVGNFFKMTGRRYKVFKLSATFLSLFSVAANHVTPVHRSLSARKVNIHYQKIMNAFQNFRLNFIKILLGLSEFKPFQFPLTSILVRHCGHLTMLFPSLLFNSCFMQS